MKTLHHIFYAVLFSLFVFTGCSGNDNESNVDSIKILNVADGKMALDKSATFQLNVETMPSHQAVSFYSSNSAVFTVNSTGMLTAVDAGTATLYVVNLHGETRQKTSCEVMVIGYIENIRLTRTSPVLLDEGSTFDVSPYFEIYPLNIPRKSLKYQSSDPSIVTVDDEGVVTPIKKGTVEITAYAAEGNGSVTSDPLKIFVGYVTTELSKSGWTAVASEEYWFSYDGNKIIDNNVNTFWHNNIDNPKPPYIILVDMKTFVTFNKIITQRSSADPRTIEFYITEKTGDGVDMNDNTFNYIGKVEYVGWEAQQMIDFWLEGKTFNSRYLKLVLPDSNNEGSNNLSEIYLYHVN